MANAYQGLAELLLINDQNLADLDVSDLFNDAPLLGRLAADTASNGTQHKYTKETGAPTVGFRAPNVGIENKKSADQLVTIDLSILDASFNVDKAVADAYAKGGPEAFIAREARRHLKQAMSTCEKQYLYGKVAGAGDGFVGMADVLANRDDEMVLDAGGSGDKCTSVWLVRTSINDLCAIAGQSGQIVISPSITQAIDPLGDGKTFTGYHTPILGWLGLQAGSKFSFVRICNIDASHPLDDEMIYKALKKFPETRQPNLIIANRDSIEMLRNSRTATNTTGAPAPRPTDVEGIPIVGTPSISSTETALTDAGSGS